MLCLRNLFFFNAPAPTEIYTLSLHDALPISRIRLRAGARGGRRGADRPRRRARVDRKSTRLNSSHPSISYAVFCLKKKMNCRKTEKEMGRDREWTTLRLVWRTMQRLP